MQSEDYCNDGWTTYHRCSIFLVDGTGMEGCCLGVVGLFRGLSGG